MLTKTRENCARPGCQHDALVHDGYGCRGRAGVRDLRRDAEVKCSCPSYRTQAQQEAWEEAVAANELMLQCVEDNAKAVALKHLLELYP